MPLIFTAAAIGAATPLLVCAKQLVPYIARGGEPSFHRLSSLRSTARHGRRYGKTPTPGKRAARRDAML
jgi:hypothetical protein